jgi:Na+-driven multidrug efflux pump
MAPLKSPCISLSPFTRFFLLGASTALDTMGSQAYGACNQAALVTVSFTAAVVLSLLCAILSASNLFDTLMH